MTVKDLSMMSNTSSVQWTPIKKINKNANNTNYKCNISVFNANKLSAPIVVCLE
jgi:hypothetical protein